MVTGKPQHDFYQWIQTHQNVSPEETAAAYKRWIDTTELEDETYQLKDLIEWVMTCPDAVDRLHQLRAVYSYDDIVFTAKSLSEKQKILFRPIFVAAFKLPHPVAEFPEPEIAPPVLTSANVDCVANMLVDICGLHPAIGLEAMAGFRKIYHKDLLREAAGKLSVKNKNIIKGLIVKLNEQTNL